MHHPIKFGCKKYSSSAELSLWPWTWRQQTNLLEWHSGPWWCITTPNLVTEGSAAEEISSKWTFTGILDHFCDLDLDQNRAIQSFYRTIQIMMMYHPIKWGCKKITRTADVVETLILDYMSPHYDPELEDSKPDFVHDTLAHDDASPYQIWIQKVQQLRRYSPDEHSLEYLTFPMTLT